MTKIKIFMRNIDEPIFDGVFEYLEWEEKPKKFFMAAHSMDRKSCEIVFEFDDVEDAEGFIEHLKNQLNIKNEE